MFVVYNVFVVRGCVRGFLHEHKVKKHTRKNPSVQQKQVPSAHPRPSPAPALLFALFFSFPSPSGSFFFFFFCSFFPHGACARMGKAPRDHSRLENLATPLLTLNGDAANVAARARRGTSRGHLSLEIPAVVGDNGHYGLFENLVDAAHLFAAALHVLGAHLLAYGETLLRRHGGQALGLEHVDARLLVSQVRLETDEDKRRVGAEV